MSARRFGSYNSRLGLAVIAMVPVAALLVASAAHAATVVNCIGEQTTVTTEGSTSAQNWPPVLGTLLGNTYTVKNDGVNAGKITDGSAVSATSLMGSPGIIIIGPFAEHDYAAGITEATWQADYKKAVDMYLALTPQPTVYVMTPPPATFVYQSAAEQTFATDVVKPAVLAVAAGGNTAGKTLKVIDLSSDAALVTAADVAGDGHFSAAGMAEVAALAYKCVAMDMCGSGSTGAGGSGGGGAGGAAGSTGAAGGTGAAGASGAAGAGGAGGTTAGTAGTTGTTGAAGTPGSGTAGATGTTTGAGGTTGAAGDTGTTTGAAGDTGTTTGAGGTTTGGAGTTGAAGASGGTSRSSGGGCAIGGRATAGSLATLLTATFLAVPALRRRRRSR